MKGFFLRASARASAGVLSLTLVACGGAASKSAASPVGYAGYPSSAGGAAPQSEAMVSTAGEREEAPPPAASPVAPSPMPSPARIAQNNVPATPPGQPKPAPVASDAHAGAFLIYTAQLNLGVYQVESRMNDVESIARDMGGYLSLRTDQQITVRIPRAQFDAAVARIEKLGDVLHRNITAQDVTDEFVDLETRLKNARAMRDRLEILLKQAAVKEALDIERELGRITGEIESMEGKLKLLRDKIAFSTITVTFQALDNQTVRDSSILPFPWLSDLGLGPLLNVHP